jgi:hypothetical protein
MATLRAFLYFNKANPYGLFREILGFFGWPWRWLIGIYFRRGAIHDNFSNIDTLAVYPQNQKPRASENTQPILSRAMTQSGHNLSTKKLITRRS